MTGCPFRGRSSSADEGPISPRRALQETNQSDASAIGLKQLQRLPSGRARVRLLYEEYVHLQLLRSVWERPTTERPVLEPLFAAGFHGIELALLLLAEFVSDGRRYVAKRPRVELVAEDIATQCQLLTDVVDAELEEELQGGCPTSRLSLTQPFPFEGCPPTTAGPCHSPGLQRLTDAVAANLGAMSEAERNSLVKLVLNVTAAFTSFQRWTVGLGIEGQLNALRAAVGLPPVPVCHALNLDYDALCQPWRCEQTLTCEKYTHAEDFFFRTIHLGTDCWAFVALSRLDSAQAAALAGDWHAAAARATQASRILDYLGSHVMLLTSMNLRDYLHLKVELEGTSGEGSSLVKSFRPAVRSLLHPLAAALLCCDRGAAADAADAACRAASQAQQQSGSASDSEEEGPQEAQEECAAAHELHTRLMALYEFPDKQPGLYNYCKALEALESGLLGGFYFRHYCLAANVIGSTARGTMKRAVAALKAGYETPVFPLLDRCRVALGARIDAEVAHNKGRMMEEILQRCSLRQAQAAVEERAPATPPRAPGSACPTSVGSAFSAGVASGPNGGFEAARRRLYSWEGVPPAFRQEVAAELARQAAQLGLVPAPGAACPLAFLDHAWGQPAPLAQYRAWREAAALFQLGNPTWDAAFGRVLPQAAAHVLSVLGLPGSGADAPAVHFGGNSHELVGRLLSSFLEAQPGGSDGGTLSPMRLLTTDTEFYSFTRQLNRFVEAGLACVDVVPAEPADTFPKRCAAAVAAAAAAGRHYTAVYVSQVTYLSQRCLLRSIPDFVGRMRAAAAASCAAGAKVLTGTAVGGADSSQAAPLVIIDGYHSFCALPTRLGAAIQSCCFVGGLLKHAGCGANCAFLVTPPGLVLRPVFTGWLADPSVLAPGSCGIGVGSEVGYLPELALQGGTPSYLVPLLTFNHLMQLWREAQPQPITVEALHSHVLRLQDSFLLALDAAGHPAINTRTLLLQQEAACRSHTLVFAQPDAAAAKAVVDGLGGRGLAVDCRKSFVRFGFGANHSAADVDALLQALAALAPAAP